MTAEDGNYRFGVNVAVHHTSLRRLRGKRQPPSCFQVRLAATSRRQSPSPWFRGGRIPQPDVSPRTPAGSSRRGSRAGPTSATSRGPVARLAREERPALQTISMCTENRGGADASVASRFLIEASLGRKANDADADPTWRNNLPPMLPDAPATHFPGFAARSGNSSFHFAHTSSKNGDLSLVRSATIESSISPAHADGVLNAGTSPSTGREKSTDAIPRSRFAAALALRLKYGSYIRVE